VGSPAASAAEHEGKVNKSTPRDVWTSRKDPTKGTTMMTVAGVVTKQLAKLVVGHEDPDLMYDEKDGSIWKFVTAKLANGFQQI
jgi:hypothetical protein